MAFIRTAEEWLQAYRDKGAYWQYDPNAPTSPELDLHAELASKKHSDRFFNTQLLIEDETLLAEAAHDIVERFVGWLELGSDGLRHVQGVVGPARGATKLAKLVAKEIGARRGFECPWASPEKVGEGEELHMEFPPEGWKPGPGCPVLLVEDVVTTGGTTSLAEQAVCREGARVFTVVGCIVNRSGEDKVGSNANPKTVLANVRSMAPAWEPDKCPLCANGSKAIKPKPKDDPEGKNWKLLTGQIAA